MAEIRHKLEKGQKLVALPCEVTPEEKRQFVELGAGLSYGRTVVWLMQERIRLLESRRMLAQLLNECLNGTSPAKAMEAAAGAAGKSPS